MKPFQKTNKKQNSEIIAALDVGTSKVCCIIGRQDDSKNIRILGFGQQASRGVRQGKIVDLEQLEDSILNAVHTAEQMSGKTISRLIVNLPTSVVHINHVTSKLQLGGRVIEDQHIKRLVSSIKDQNINHQIIHVLPTVYELDGITDIVDPRGMIGDRLSVLLSVLTAPISLVRNISSCLARCRLEVEAFVVGGYASGLSTLVEDELSLGATLIDIGGETTSIACFIEGSLIDIRAIPMGGDHVTRDIARVLATPIAQAERLKNLYGTLIQVTSDDRESIIVPQLGELDHNVNLTVSRFYLSEIIRARMEEIFEHIKKNIPSSLSHQRIVLTGGGSQISGLRELAHDRLGGQVRIGSPHHLIGGSDSLQSPLLATCAGLLQFGLDKQKNYIPLSANKNQPQFLKNITKWIKENF